MVKPGKPPTGRASEVQSAMSRAMAYHQAGRLSEAEAIYREVLQKQPRHPDALHLLGVIALAREDCQAAVDLFRKAIAALPSAPLFHNHLGNALLELGHLSEAEQSFRRALKLQPNFVEAMNNLGLALKEQGRSDEAAKSLGEAVQLRPDFSQAHNNLGSVFLDRGEYDSAEASFRQALHLNPGYAKAHNNLGYVLLEQGHAAEALECFKHAEETNPSYAEAGSNRLFCLNYLDLPSEEIFREHKEWGDRHAAPLSSSILPHANDRSPDRRLRLGYVSGDFRTHSVAYFFEPVLAAHDRAAFEVICYSHVKRPDGTTQRLQSLAGGWRNLCGIEDSQAAQMIRDDRIDILVDLSGQSAENRLLLFARKPAPVQIAWIGYPNTSGLATMDYRITDAWADPVGVTDRFHTEKLVRLPGGFSCYCPPEESPEPGSLPSRQNGFITFGSFNNLAKLTSRVIETWSAILRAVPGSKLLLKAKQLKNEGVQRDILARFGEHSIVAHRLVLSSQTPSTRDHMGLYNEVDVGLDPFPFNGATTTCEALWMGVPVIALAGERHAGRVGVSLLSNVGLPDLIAANLEEYVAKAIELSQDSARLQELRRTLRERMKASALVDAKGFASRIEEAYREIWRR